MAIPDKLAGARLRIMIRRPYFAGAAQSVTLRPTDLLPTMAIDKFWRMYFNPDWIETLSVDQIEGVLLHEYYHLLRGHCWRAEEIGAEPRQWNYAADMSINSDLIADGQVLPEDPVIPGSYGYPEHLTTEEYYAMILDEIEKMEQDAKERGDEPNWNGNDGSGATGDSGKQEHEEGPPDGKNNQSGGLTQQEQRQVAEQTAREMRTHAKMRGTSPAGWERWIDEMLGPPKVRWENQLRFAFRRMVAEQRGRLKATYNRVPRRSIPGFITPAMRAPKSKVAAVRDTSGSMGGIDPNTPLGQATSELQGLIKSLGLTGLWYTDCDAAETEVKWTRNIFLEPIIGGGGTDMRVGITACEVVTPDVIVVFTDGDTPWPDGPPESPLIIVLTDGPRETPDYATTITVEI